MFKVNLNWESVIITEEENDRIMKWDIFDIVDWKVIFDEDTILLLEKKKQCEALILSNYSVTDQRNTLMFWTDAEKATMATYIEAMTTEFRANWKDSDFSNITV